MSLFPVLFLFGGSSSRIIERRFLGMRLSSLLASLSLESKCEWRTDLYIFLSEVGSSPLSLSISSWSLVMIYSDYSSFLVRASI